MSLELLDRLAKGDTSVVGALQDALAMGSPNAHLVRWAIRDAGSASARTVLNEHLGNFHWSNSVPLQTQEFPTLLPHDLRFEDALPGTLSTAAWGYRHVRALRAGGKASVDAARALRAGLDALADEAAGFAHQWQRLWPLLGTGLHVLQAQALMRLEAACQTVAGMRVLEVGPQDGGLMNALVERGASVEGVDIAPKPGVPGVKAGDFMSAPLGQYDAVVATAVFELGSGWTHFPSTPGDFVLLRRLKSLLPPGGLVVVENLAFPVPFNSDQAREAGFEVLDVRVVHNGVVQGGRGAVLRVPGGKAVPGVTVMRGAPTEEASATPTTTPAATLKKATAKQPKGSKPALTAKKPAAGKASAAQKKPQAKKQAARAAAKKTPAKKATAKKTPAKKPAGKAAAKKAPGKNTRAAKKKR
jgi:hypothetical protein